MARHRGMVAPIHSIKHYVPRSKALVAVGTSLNVAVLDSVDPAAVTLVNEVVEGSIVKAVFLEYWLLNNDVSLTDTQFMFTVEKAPSNLAAITHAQQLIPGDYTNKNNILFFSQGVLSGGDTTAIPVLRQWVLIPKGKQRMSLGDRIVVTIGTVAEPIQVCGFATYKEYS